MKYDVILLASGKGSRMGLGYNKLLYRLGEKRLIDLACEPFLQDEECEQIILVSSDLQPKDCPHYKVLVVAGGESRQESAYIGVQYALSPYVLIHDGARVNLSMSLLQYIKQALKEGEDCVMPVIEQDNHDGSYQVEGKVIQTPQGFQLLTIQQAHEMAVEDSQKPLFRDDASLVKHYLGKKPCYIEGDLANFKITTLEDLKRLEPRSK